jgi:hypothetical protein
MRRDPAAADVAPAFDLAHGAPPTYRVLRIRQPRAFHQPDCSPSRDVFALFDRHDPCSCTIGNYHPVIIHGRPPDS